MNEWRVNPSFFQENLLKMVSKIIGKLDFMATKHPKIGKEKITKGDGYFCVFLSRIGSKFWVFKWKKLLIQRMRFHKKKKCKLDWSKKRGSYSTSLIFFKIIQQGLFEFIQHTFDYIPQPLSKVLIFKDQVIRKWTRKSS